MRAAVESTATSSSGGRPPHRAGWYDCGVGAEAVRSAAVRSRGRTLAACYLLLQAVAVPVWWTALASSPGFRAVFELGDPAVLDAFLPADVAFAAASAAAGFLAAAGHRAAPVLAAGTLGAVVCSTAMTCAHAAAAGTGAVGVAAMVCAVLGSLAALLLLLRDGNPR